MFLVHYGLFIVVLVIYDAKLGIFSETIDIKVVL